MKLSLINAEAFSQSDFSVGSFLAGLCKEVLAPTATSGPKPDTSTAAAAARVSLDKARSITALLDKAETEAVSAHGEVSRSAAALHKRLSSEEARYKRAVSAAEKQSQSVRESFKELEERSNRVAQVSTRLGDRLQRADTLRARALELVELLEHLQRFAFLPDPAAGGGEGGGGGGGAKGDGQGAVFVARLPGLYWEDANLAEAAAIARKLRALTSDADAARQRSRIASSVIASGSSTDRDRGPLLDALPSRRELAPAPGSLEYCTRRLGEYCNWLEVRVVSRFDRAAEDDNLRVMAECARIMAAFDRERAIIQRYIGLLPAFQSSLDGLQWVRQPAISADDAAVAERLKPLGRLFASLAETVGVEAGRMAAVFPDAKTALQMLAVKVFEDRVEMALERLLEDTADDAFSDSAASDKEDEEEGEQGARQLQQQHAGSRGRGGGGGRTAGRQLQPGRAAGQRAGYGSSGSGGDSDDSGSYDGSSSGGGSYSGTGSGSEYESGSEGRGAGPSGRGAGSSGADGGGERRRPKVIRGKVMERRRRQRGPGGAAAAGARGSPAAAAAASGPSAAQLDKRARLSLGRRGGLGGVALDLVAEDEDDAAVARAGAGAEAADSDSGPSVLALHLYLRLLAAAYVRTSELAEQVEAATAGQVDVGPLVDAAFEVFLKLYPAPELQWLDAMAERELSPVDASGHPASRVPLTLEAAEALIRRNREAVQRCLLMVPPPRLPAAVRLLYVGEAPYDGTMPGSLMEHLPKFLMDGVERELEISLLLDHFGGPNARNCWRLPYQPPPPPGSKGPPPPVIFPPPLSRAEAALTAQAFVDVRLAPVLGSVRTASAVVARLQEHHTQVVLPALCGSAPELAACGTGLMEALRALERCVLGVMRGLVDMFVVQAEKVLMVEQRRTDFAPPGGQLDAEQLDRPTTACLLVTALFAALAEAARECLDGPNLSSLLLDVGLRMHATFLNHMQQYIYNAAGALRWRNDVSRYCEALRGWGLPQLDARMSGIGSLVGILVVEPEQLLPLINSTLQLDHREAIRFVRLREDYLVARVQGGRSLWQVFGGEEAVPGQLGGMAGQPGQGQAGRR